jgi:uncharacterized protein (TIGR02217 family)
MSDSFSETRINDLVPYLISTSGGPQFQTNVIVVQSGYEQRNKSWAFSRGNWQLGERVVVNSEKEALINFFYSRKGKFQAFRFKDWADFKVDHTNGILGTGFGTGHPEFDLYKTYSDGDDTYLKRINKPVPGTVVVKQNGTIVPSAVDYTTGTLNLSPNRILSISGISKAASMVVTTTAPHGLGDGDIIFIDGVVGMTQANNRYYYVTKIDNFTFYANQSLTVATNSTGYTTYVSDGTVSVYAQPGDTLTWSGEFDVPVRFDTDMLQFRLEEIVTDTNSGVQTPWFYILALPLVEVRL